MKLHRCCGVRASPQSLLYRCCCPSLVLQTIRAGAFQLSEGRSARPPPAGNSFRRDAAAEPRRQESTVLVCWLMVPSWCIDELSVGALLYPLLFCKTTTYYMYASCNNSATLKSMIMLLHNFVIATFRYPMRSGSENMHCGLASGRP